ESGRGSAKEDYFAEKRNPRRQRRVGRALSQVLRRRAAPTWHRDRAGRAAPAALTFPNWESQNSVFEWGTPYPPCFAQVCAIDCDGWVYETVPFAGLWKLFIPSVLRAGVACRW